MNVTAGACHVYLECTTGLGDMILDVISGVSVALERGCVRPLVHTRWEWKDRKYDWPRILHSELFLMDEAIPVDPSELWSLHHRAKTSPLHMHGGAWPARFNLSSSNPSTVIVTYPTIQHPEGNCGSHSVDRWLPAMLPGVPQPRLLDVTRRVALSLRFPTAALPPAGMASRVVVHARRGDKLEPTRLAKEGGEANLRRVYEGVIDWLRHAGHSQAYLVTDDPQWGRSYAERLNARGIDTLFNFSSSPMDDLQIMLGGKAIILAALVSSKFSALAATLSGVPLYHFALAAPAAGNHSNSAAAATATARNRSITRGPFHRMNLTLLPLEDYAGEHALHWQHHFSKR